MQSSSARAGGRHGSPWTGLGTVVAKETADHLSSARMRIPMATTAVACVGICSLESSEIASSSSAGAASEPS